jgi:hypothetical protein
MKKWVENNGSVANLAFVYNVTFYPLLYIKGHRFYLEDNGKALEVFEL